MKLSVDLDETFTKHPDFFKTLRDILKSSGHEVGILTGRMLKDCLETINTHEWDFIITDEENYTVDGKFKLTMEEHAKQWKSRMIREHGIDCHFDDCAEWIRQGGVAGCKVIKI